MKKPEHVPVRYRIINKKRRPVCDYGGTCKSLAFKEVYPGMLKKGRGWGYLCRKHFKQEQKFFKNKLPYVGIGK